MTREALRVLLPLLCGLISVTSGMAEAESNESLASAVVGGGCFWCVEAAYEGLPGVVAVVSGYAGGSEPNPTYETVSSGRSGHAEVVRIDFDPGVISYEEVLGRFWEAHDPTTLNRQGADVGPQYRSIILFASPEEREIAERSMAAAQAKFSSPIVTEIAPLHAFYEAEGYHQNFFERNPAHPYSRAVIRPKLDKLSR